MILVTGGAGYIGSVTVEMLRSRGEGVVILDNLSRGHRSAISPDVPFYEGDIGDRELIARIASENQIEACIHFVALLDALLKAGVRRLVFSSTCATYGEPIKIPIAEDHPQQPTNPYGWSKLFMERIMESYDRAYGLKFVALRYFNACGASSEFGEYHEPESHLVPNVLRAALGQIPAVSVFGNTYPTPDGTAIRDYIHVSDLGQAHILALDYLRAGRDSERINLGNGHGYSVMEVIQTARQVTGRPIAINIEPRRPGDPSRLVADAEKARTLLGWRPAQPDLASILRTDWEWRTKHPQGYLSPSVS